MKYAALLVSCLVAAHAMADEMGMMRKMSDNKFMSAPGLPSCVEQAVQSGDPATGPSILLFKGKAGCRIPWHWHTPTENVMLVSGTAKIEMKDSGKAATLGAGGFATTQSKHVHQFQCKTACVGFVSSDAAFDIHYVDSAGNEITPEVALAKHK